MIKKYLSLIKFSHTIFALPFALVGFFLGVNTNGFSFSGQTLGYVLLCMVFARSAAMAFNRWQDRDIDGKNPRTLLREIPAGVLSPNAVLFFVVLSSFAFIITTYFINQICFYLSPIALGIVLGYSYTKRYTALCHLILGLGLALAPIGAYLAVTGKFDLIPILYSIAVLFWVAGFDIIYALQDEDFDKINLLNSIPVKMGKNGALQVSNIFHFFSAALMVIAAYRVSIVYHEMYAVHIFGLAVFLALLVYQHTLVKVDDLSKVNIAFFTTNGIASLIFGTLFILDFYL